MARKMPASKRNLSLAGRQLNAAARSPAISGTRPAPGCSLIETGRFWRFSRMTYFAEGASDRAEGGATLARARCKIVIAERRDPRLAGAGHHDPWRDGR